MVLGTGECISVMMLSLVEFSVCEEDNIQQQKTPPIIQQIFTTYSFPGIVANVGHRVEDKKIFVCLCVACTKLAF